MRYNHFAESPYKEILFSDIKIGEKFRSLLYRSQRKSGTYIVMIKTGDFTCMEARSKKEKTYHSANHKQYEYEHINK